MSTATAAVSNIDSAIKRGGPRTPEGRATSSKNATTHGLSMHGHAYLPDEDPEEFIALLDGLLNDLQPVGVLEHVLVRKAAEAEWKLRRAARFEAEALEAERAEQDGAGMAVYRDAHKANVLTVIVRYGGSAERAFYAALHELQRLQAARRGAQVPVPVALDVTLTDAREVTTDGSGERPYGP
jgi:hypothetical protein